MRADNSRLNKTALLAAIVAAMLGVALLWLYKRGFEQKVSGGERVSVVIATQDIPFGVRLDQTMVAIRDIPSAFVEERHIRAVDIKQVLGVRVSMGLRANETVLWTDLATSERRRNLSGLVRSGMRAVTIQADASSAFGGLLRPGDRVDVLMTVERRGQVTVPLLQNVLVLAVGQDLGPKGASQGGGGANQVTLSVTVEQAQVLTLGGSSGRLTLTLRNPDDVRVVEKLPETTQPDIIRADRREDLIELRAPGQDSPTPTNIGGGL